MFVIRRDTHNPLITPIKSHSWEEVSTCNWCPVSDSKGGGIHAFYRAMSMPDRIEATDLNRSSIGYTFSRDGKHFNERRQFLKPQEEWEYFGCEDPRVTFVDGEYFIFYTALSQYPLNANGIRVGVARSKDCKEVYERHLVTPFNAKAMTLFPERINGKLVALLSVNTDRPPAHFAFAEFEKAEDMWDRMKWEPWYENIDDHAIDLRRSDSDHVEVGAPPIRVKDGWLVIYSHILNYFSGNRIFGIEAVLLDYENPRKILGRTHGPIMLPEAVYEQYGLVKDVTFPSGALVHGDILDIYYGASDTTGCRASLRLDDLLNAMKPETRMRVFTRHAGNPILRPSTENEWESMNVLNPGAIDLDGSVHILYRAQDKHRTSVIGYARSEDGLTIDYKHPDPVYVPRADFEMKKGDPNGNSGCEDPRLTRIGGRIYMCYTAYDGVSSPRVALSSIAVDDFLKEKWEWSDPVLITPQGVDDKDACVFPEKVHGKPMIMHRVKSHICADYIESLDIHEPVVDRCIEILDPRPGMWDTTKVGIASPPLKTEAGWLLFYHGVSTDSLYRVGAALLDFNDPTVVLSRTADALFEPQENYELIGEKSNVVFPCGAIIRDDTLFLYYGGADRVVGVATASLSEILQILM